MNSVLGHEQHAGACAGFMLEHVLVTCWGAAGGRCGTRPKKKRDVEEGPPLRGALSIGNLEAILGSKTDIATF